MKIGLLTQEYHFGEGRFGGVGRAFGKMAHWMVAHGHEVTVYHQDRDASEVEERPGLRIVRVVRRPRLHWRLQSAANRLPGALGGWLWHYEVDCALSERILADYRAGRIEVLLASRGVTAPDLMIRRRLPTVVRMQYSLIRKQRVERLPVSWLDRYHDFVEHRAIRRATRVYAPCRFTSDYAASFTSRPIKVIRTPMFEIQPPAEWAAVQARYQLPASYDLFWGGMVRVKGIHILAEALPDVFARDETRHMVIVGSRRYTNERGESSADSMLALKERYPSRITILPSMEPPELFAIIQHADAAVLPSLMDNLPNTLLEAMYFGKVIVASRGASLDELIEHEKEGLLVKPGNADALADAMLRAASLDSSARSALGAAAASKVRALCSPERVMPQLIDLCAETIVLYNQRRRQLLFLP